MAVMILILFMQSFEEFTDMMNDTWTKRFGANTSRQHDLQDALHCYDTMWLGALALDLAETKLQNMTPNLNLGDFNYTGNHSTIIKDAIYKSALNITFTGATVSRVDTNRHHLKSNIRTIPPAFPYNVC